MQWIQLIEAKVEQQVAKLRANFMAKEIQRDLTSAQHWLAKYGNDPTTPDDTKKVMNRRASSYQKFLTNPNHPYADYDGIYYILSNLERIFDQLVEADPSQSKKYLSWIIRWFSNSRSREDLDKVREYLDVINRGLVRGVDVNRFTTLPELYQAIRPGLAKAQDLNISKEERAKINAETEVRYRGPEGMIVIPKSERASQFWGRGTQWCTAATKSRCFFNDYNSKGPLYIIMMADGGKYQLSLVEAQFMDETDARVDADKFVVEHPWVPDALNLSNEELMPISRHYDDILPWLSEKNKNDPELFHHLIRRSSLAIMAFSQNLRTGLIESKPQWFTLLTVSTSEDYEAMFRGIHKNRQSLHDSAVEAILDSIPPDKEHTAIKQALQLHLISFDDLPAKFQALMKSQTSRF